jgi:hypothetical protein
MSRFFFLDRSTRHVMRVSRELFFPDAAGLALALVPGRRRQGGFLWQIDPHTPIASTEKLVLVAFYLHRSLLVNLIDGKAS